VIRPWCGDPDGGPYPVIVWANGWGWNNNAGETTTLGYKPGLIEWAVNGPFIVVAANQWSVQESDVLQCLQWIIDQNDEGDSQYENVVNTGKIGLSGHSQGGGAIIKAGDGKPNGFEITATVAMNPYGPSWVRPGNQDGPMFIIGGTDDTTTPTSSFSAVWEAIQGNGEGGIHAELQRGTHNDDAWAPEGADPEDHDFGKYQSVTQLWWNTHLKGSLSSYGLLLDELADNKIWESYFTDGDGSVLEIDEEYPF
jgi:dienelactone hydrolase